MKIQVEDETNSYPTKFLSWLNLHSTKLLVLLQIPVETN